MFEKVDEAMRAVNAAQAVALAEIAAIDETGAWRAEGSTSATAWLRGRYGSTKSTALEWVRVARALRSLPVISAAFARGELSFEQLRPPTKFATLDTDEELARSAQSRSAPDLWDEARRRERVSEPKME